MKAFFCLYSTWRLYLLVDFVILGASGVSIGKQQQTEENIF